MAGPTPAAVAAGDPVLAALERRDAYVSPRVLGPAAASGEGVLTRTAAVLGEAGRPVKLAIVPGPAGAPSLRVYAQRLARRLGREGTLVVTVPDGRTVAVGPTPGPDLQARLRAARIGRVPNPVERLARAAQLTAVPVATEEPDGLSPTLALMIIALLGGGWAAAIGLGRSGRLERRRLAEARAGLRVYLDALRSRSIALARRPGLGEDRRRRVEGTLGDYADVVSALQEARRTSEVHALAGRVRSALGDLAAVGAEIGESIPADHPFAGLCAVDPAHGAATGEGRVAGIAQPVGICAACRELADSGTPPTRRSLAHEGRPVPFDEAPTPGAPGSADG